MKVSEMTVEEFANLLTKEKDKLLNFDSYREGQRRGSPVIASASLRRAMKRRASNKKPNRAGF